MLLFNWFQRLFHFFNLRIVYFWKMWTKRFQDANHLDKYIGLQETGEQINNDDGQAWTWLCWTFSLMLPWQNKLLCIGNMLTLQKRLFYLSIFILFYTFGWLMFCSVLFFSRPRSEGWPHHGRTFCIYLCPLSFWLTLPRGVLSTSWCCPSRPCVVFLVCAHLASFLALVTQKMHDLKMTDKENCGSGKSKSGKWGTKTTGSGKCRTGKWRTNF